MNKKLDKKLFKENDENKKSIIIISINRNNRISS